MKKTVKIILLLAIAVLAAGSCKKEIFSKKGEKISFGAGAASDATKLSYGSVDGSKNQAINWTVGDKIMIAGLNCPTTVEGASNPATYKVTEVTSGKENYGKIDIDGTGLGLVWGEPGTQHSFYAVYPASKTGASISVSTDGAITGCVIPAVQGYTGTPAAGTTSKGEDAIIVQPDMTNLYMVAKIENVESGSKISQGGEEVFLDFKPLSTALEFTIENGFDGTDAMKVVSVAVGSEGENPYILNGGFKVDMTKDGLYERPMTRHTESSPTASNSKVAINFSTPVEVAKGGKLNFTFFLNPGNFSSYSTGVDVEGLYFEITFKDNRDATGVKTLTRKAVMKKKNGDAKEAISFPTHKKTHIYGLLVPEYITFDIEGDVVVVPWDESFEGEPVFEKDGDGYIEHFKNWGPGIEIAGTVWAPVNCGIWDGEYPVGKFYQWNRQYGQVMDSDPTFVTETQSSAAAGNDVSFKDSFFKNAGCWYSGNSVYDTWTYNPCPKGWRTPTIDEIRALMGAGYTKASGMTFDGKSGGSYSGYIFGTGDNQIFLPGNGYRAGISGYYVTDGVVNYWSNTAGSDKNYGQYLCTYDNNVHVASDIRSMGYNVRCVLDEKMLHYIETVNDTDYDYGPGIKVGSTIWAPVNCGVGVKDTDHPNGTYPYGKIYQWGRKDGLGYYDATYSPNETDPDVESTFLGTNGVYTGTYPLSSTTFYKCDIGGTYAPDWIYNGSNLYWNKAVSPNDATQTGKITPTKGDFDPCPDEWRLPTYYELSALFGENQNGLTEGIGGLNGFYFNGTNNCTSSTTGAKVFLPAAGLHLNLSAENCLRGTCGFYWSSSVNGNYGMSLVLDDTNRICSASRAYGYSVRCVYDGK